MLNLKLDYKAVIAAALVGSVAVWVAKKSAAEAIDAVVDKIAQDPDKFNPVKEENYVNQAFQNLWTGITGIDKSPGSWFYDYMHPPKEGNI